MNQLKKITEGDRQESFKQLSPDFQELYGSTESGEHMYTIFNKYVQEETLDTYRLFAQTIGDTILGFYKVSELPQLLKTQMGVDDTIAQKITTEMLDVLDPIIQHEDKNTIKKSEMLNLADSFAKKSTPEQSVAEASEAEQPKQEKNTIPASHTMEDDMNRVHGYGAYRHNNPREKEGVMQSNQDDVLKRQ